MINRQTALDILNANADSLPNLIEQAYQLRTKYKGNRVSIQLLTNVRSGNCTQNCAYCAQSRDSAAPIEKYRYVEDKKLYGDNDLVDEMHLARHCIGLSGIRFADDDIENLPEHLHHAHLPRTNRQPEEDALQGSRLYFCVRLPHRRWPESRRDLPHHRGGRLHLASGK